MSEALLAQVRRTILTHRLLTPRERVLVAVSGGADSVALLHLLLALQSSWRLTLRVAHLDHALRPESAEDAAFVRTLGDAWRVPTTIERRDVRAISAREGWSLEDGARRVRYQFLLETARRESLDRIALAHTADDQAETVLMRLVRGTGLLGLGAIPITRPLEETSLIRPLLKSWRCDITAYLRRARLAHREDATNEDPRFVRNRIRHELLPLLERQYNPRIKATLTHLAEQSRCDYAYLEDAAERQWRRTVKVAPRGPSRRRATHPAHRDEQVTIAIAPFLRHPKALQRQLARRAIQRVRGEVGQFEFRHWLEIERLFLERPAGTVVDLPGGVQWQRGAAHVTCRLASSAAPTPAADLLD